MTGAGSRSAPVVEVDGLTARAGDAVLVDGVDLRVPAGRVTALVGPSGSGKTTTALALLGEAEPGVRLTGRVRVAGTEVVTADGVAPGAAAVRGGTLAYMPQHPGSTLNPARRIGAVLAELARLHRAAEPDTAAPGKPTAPAGRVDDAGRTPAGRPSRAAGRRHAAEALRQAQLPDAGGLLRRFPHQFSGGQRQRVALAQVLACGPRALVLDEPGTGLDTVTRMGLARELAALARTGIAVLLLSHDHDLVRALADHAVLLERGRVVGEGAPERLLPPPAARPAGVPDVPDGGRGAVPDRGLGSRPAAEQDPGPVSGPAAETAPASPRDVLAGGGAATDPADDGAPSGPVCGDAAGPAGGAAPLAPTRTAGRRTPDAENNAATEDNAGTGSPPAPEDNAATAGAPGPDSAAEAARTARRTATGGTDGARTGLAVHDLTAWLRPAGRDEVLHAISLSLPPGGCLGVAGRSGSGKTTLARCIAGLHERHRGRIRLDGAELPVLRRRTTGDKRRVQYVWQEVRNSFDERRPVLTQVARTAVRLRGLSAEQAAGEARGLLARLGVPRQTAERLPAALSGGELQRAAFARAVLARPDVLVCDEVTTALDPAAAGLVVDEVLRLRREERTAVLWIGHDLGLLRTVADRLLVLDGGAVAEEGDCADVLDTPRSPIARLLRDADRMADLRTAPHDAEQAGSAAPVPDASAGGTPETAAHPPPGAAPAPGPRTASHDTDPHDTEGHPAP